MKNQERKQGPNRGEKSKGKMERSFFSAQGIKGSLGRIAEQAWIAAEPEVDNAWGEIRSSLDRAMDEVRQGVDKALISILKGLDEAKSSLVTSHRSPSESSSRSEEGAKSASRVQ